MGTGAVRFVQPGAAPQSIRQALAALNTNYLATLDSTESQIGRVLATSAARQAEVIIDNLDAFERDGSQIFATSRNLAVLQQLTEALAELDVPARNQAQAIWTASAMDLQQALEEHAPALGIKLGPTDFGRASLEQIHVGTNNAFSELSDFAQLQTGNLVNLKTGLGDAMARGLDWRSIGKQVETTGIEALPAIPGFRRAFGLEERGQMIARTETVRINTQLQDVFGEEAGLEWGRSYLNWHLTTHSELCLWAESMGWAPIGDFQGGPGLPPRHTSCGCSWQRGSPDWLDKDHSLAASAEFARLLKSDDIKISPELLKRLPPAIASNVLDAVKASSKKLQLPKNPRPFEPLKEIPRLNPAKEAAPVALLPTFSSIAHKEIGAGVKTVEHATRVGKLIDKEWTSRVGIRRTAFQDDIQASEAQMQALANEANAVVARLAALPTQHPDAPELRKEWRQRVDEQIAETKKTTDLKDQLATLDREALRGMIAELRALGAVEQEWAKGSTSKARTAVATVSELIPTSWLEASRLFGELQGRTVQRGFYRHLASGPSVIAVSDRGVQAHGFESTALHEMGHRFERTVPALLALERELYEQRTSGDKLQWMGSGFRRNEVTRKDNWTHKYMGKDYKGVAYELLSMALESVYYGTYDLRKDEGMLHWILGILAGA